VGSPYAKRYQVFLDRLVTARKLAQMTQRDAAQAMGMSQAMIWKCEKGERRIDVVEFERFAKIYGKPLRFFLPRER
jgi:transcriptional regulator with XRE-family HTH domain